MKARATAVLLIACGVLLGALREFLFLNLNYQLDHVRRGTAYSYAQSRFQSWTAGADLAGLVALKWALAAGFVAIMLVLAVALARVLVGDHRYRTPLVAGTLITGSLALALHAAAAVLPALEAVGVKLLHALQFPVVLLLILLAVPLIRRTRS